MIYIATAGNGSPIQGDQTTYSCTNIQIPNATSPTGFTGGSSCTSSPYYDGSTIWYNVVFWTPLVGAMIYAMPSWIEPARQNVTASLSRILKGAVPVGTLILLTFGLDNSSSGYPELFNGHSPFNPFVAYNYCDSTTFGVISCVQVNAGYYLIDYVFWIAVAALLVLVTSEFFDYVREVVGHKGGANFPPVNPASALASGGPSQEKGGNQ